MTGKFEVIIEGLDAVKDIDSLPVAIARRARMAVNKTAQRSRGQAAIEINRQVAFPSGYLAPRNRRLSVTKLAQSKDLEAVITGRQRATSLARFATSTPNQSRKQGGVSVKVAPNRRKLMKGAFLVKLRAGKAPIDTKHNLGLAIRLKAGERIRNKKIQMSKLGSGLYLLYAPSVDQVFIDVAKKEAPVALQYLEAEFLRLMDAGV